MAFQAQSSTTFGFALRVNNDIVVPEPVWSRHAFEFSDINNFFPLPVLHQCPATDAPGRSLTSFAAVRGRPRVSFQGLGRHAFGIARYWIDSDAGVLQGYSAENRLAIFRAEDDLGNGFTTHEADACEAEGIFHDLAVGKFVDILPLDFDDGGSLTYRTLTL